MLKLSPSLLSADFSQLNRDINIVAQAGAQYIHLDVMDGVFVPNITFGAPVIKALRKVSDIVFDVHLMIIDPIKYIDDFCKAGADIITFHVESISDPAKTIEKIKMNNVKAGIVIKPHTTVKAIEKYLDMVDMVLVMSVEPGFGGQKFMPHTLDKVKELAGIKKDKNLNFEIEIDGGIGINNVREVIEAGVEVVVAGSAVFGAEDITARTKEFLEIFKEFEK